MSNSGANFESLLPPSVVSETRESLQTLIGPLGATALVSKEDLNIRANTTSLAPAEDWTKGSGVGDSGPAFASAFTAAVAAEVADPSGASTVKRGRRRIVIPAGSFYTSQAAALMTAGGNRTSGLRYMGAGKALTQIYFQPKVGNPRTFLDAETVGTELKSATAAFTAEDKGHLVFVYGAGPGGGVLAGVITSYINATTVLLGLAATTNVSGAACEILPDAALFYNSDKHAAVQIENIEFIGMSPTETIPPTTVADGSVGLTVTNAAMASGSKVLTSAAAGFSQDMIGLTITVEGAAGGGGTLTTTISEVNSLSSLNLVAANASGGAIANKHASVFSNRLTLGRVVTDAAITVGKTALTSATAAFTLADLGTTIGVEGAGGGGGQLLTTIQSVVSGTEVLVAQVAETTVVGATLTMGGKIITGKFIGNNVSIAGAGAAGATLTTMIRAIDLRDVNGVPTLECLLAEPCLTVVTNAATSFHTVANAVLWRATSNGGVTGPVFTNCVYRGVWAHGHLLDGTNQDADVYWCECDVYERPGTFLQVMRDPALENANDQQLDYVFDKGIWAPYYGDLVFFDGRGGFIKMKDGSQTLGAAAEITEDSGGVLPVTVGTGGGTDPGGTWFKLRDRSAVQNHRMLVLDKPRFEHRNDACRMFDIEWSVGHVVVCEAMDDNIPSPNTNPLTFFARVGYIGATGPSIRFVESTLKGRHLYRYKNAAWQHARTVTYDACHIIQQSAGALFAICNQIDLVASAANQPVIHFINGTKTSTAAGTTGYQDHADTDVNWKTGSQASMSRRWRVWCPGGNSFGLPATAKTSTMLVGYGALVVRLQLYVPVVAGQSTNTDWEVKITDNEEHAIHTFKVGEDGVAAGKQWNQGIFLEVVLSTPFLCTSNANRTLLAKVLGTGTTANTSAFVAAETIG